MLLHALVLVVIAVIGTAAFSSREVSDRLVLVKCHSADVILVFLVIIKIEAVLTARLGCALLLVIGHLP